MKKLLLIFLALCIPRASALTCVAVAPTSAGAADGTSWSNARTVPTGTSWTRGNLYYLADGLYGTTLSVSTVASGTTTIEIRKAQSFDFGRSSDGCTNDISAGWNTGTMGSAQAYWQANPGSPASLYSLSAYVTVNGNGSGVSNDQVGCGGMYSSPTSTNVVAPPSPSGCGIKFDDSTCTSTANQGCGAAGSGINRTLSTGDIFEWTEQFGNGGRGPSLSTAGGTYPNEYYWTWVQSTSSFTISHSYYHNMMTTYLLLNGGNSNTTVNNNIFWGMYDQSTSHAEAVQVQGTNTSFNMYNNILRDQTTNGDVVVIGATSGNLNGLNYYNNIDVCTNGTSSNDALYGTSCNHTQGMLGCINAGAVCANFNVYNNTMAQVGGGSGGTFNCGTANSAGGTVTNFNFENNLFYNCGSFQVHQGSSGTWDYNAYLNSGQAAVGAHDSSSGSSPNPFVSLSTANLNIASENALWISRISLGSPYDNDIIGTAFTSDRGAYQFLSSGGAPTAPGMFTFSWPPPKVNFTWAASTTPGVEYKVYRSAIHGGPYTKLQAAIKTLSYSDARVILGNDYFYVVTAYLPTGCTSNCESPYSTEVAVTCCQ